MNKILLLALCLAMVTSCNRTPEKTVVNTTKTQPTPIAAKTATPRQPAQAPSNAELQAVIKRNYADAVDVDVDDTRPTPFITGDFNGDNSEDIAIFVKPRKLSDVNSEFANWTLEDPHHIQQVAHNVTASDVLLAVIHGQEREGWRNESARQTYLLENVAGTDFAAESVRQLNETGKSASLPQLRGDVMHEKLNGSGGIIYWTGAKYAWHPVS